MLGATLVAVAVALGCGSDERKFSADDFVHEANGHGADLRLGEPLSASDPDTELYALSFSGSPSAGTAAEGAGGSLRVTDGSAAAKQEFGRCQRASLICFRAANVVVNLQQEASPRDLARLSRAVRAMQSD